ncbi:DNA mismatch repair endonuclease MutH [Candidatus Pantoea edessiphila]|uniref:DNA mismatch repair protein MutH n=1 Tax=Candidatus Pantoea edessiphila TaxID=2044610 RepID=A0A2P5SVP3_9GAMM|nr:DNA mismatch repair endonuclease MutH [Candidatus Pantoea edessiphila]PPI86404.1 DNA mismatch repair endonuclease MutH [Candidatus Pantoea edessiphila]
MNYLFNPPKNKITLLARSQALAGFTIGNLASLAGLVVPENLKKNKGWIGKLIELYLGANSQNKAEQDFVHLGIELKTIPIDSSGNPKESTFICTASLINNVGISWKTSNVRNKLSSILWVPIESNTNIPLKNRRIGISLLWRPSLREDIMLRKDWEEIINMIIFGQVNYINNFHGMLLKLQPKALNKNILTKGIGDKGENIMTIPRSFYLRKSFTKIILSNNHIV